jgi:transcriptional regulator with XRE-family HTH domain
MPRKMPKAWFHRMAKLELEQSVNIGRPVGAVDYSDTHDVENEASQAESIGVTVLPVALRTLVQHWRREKRWSVETAAEKIGIAVEELIEIESDPYATYEARAIYFLANAMKVPQERLAQLAGMVEDVEPNVRLEAVRFAAHSAPVAELNRQEREDLQAFLSVLRDHAK